jgi:FixJ family two-component response regulator
MKVLVVEDDASMRRAIRRLVTAARHDCIAFGTAEAMLQSGEATSADCIVSDVHLPAMSGLELIEAMQQAHCEVPIILITAFDMPGLRLEAQRRGVAAYLVKPFGGPELLEAIGQARSRPCHNP